MNTVQAPRADLQKWEDDIKYCENKLENNMMARETELGQLRAYRAELRSKNDELQTELRACEGEMRTDLLACEGALRNELQTEMKAYKEDLWTEWIASDNKMEAYEEGVRLQCIAYEAKVMEEMDMMKLKLQKAEAREEEFEARAEMVAPAEP